MLFFIDESLSTNQADSAPYNVLCGVAVKELQLWNLIQAIRAAEREYFGTLLSDEFKGKNSLRKKLFDTPMWRLRLTRKNE